MKKILIIGGAGFIGFHLSKKLLKLGYKVDILDNFSRGSLDIHLKKLLKDKNSNLINLDILIDKIEDKLSNDYFGIFHLAAIVGVQNVISSPYSVLEKNSILTLKAISIAKNQKNLKKFLFASTSEIYSKSIEILKTKIPTPENTSVVLSNPSNKRSTYFLTKIFGESLVHHSKLPFIIFRPHNIYGPRMGMSHVIPEIIFKLKKAKKNISAYSASHTRSFCYIDDAVNQLVFMLSKSYVVKKTFNLGNQLEEISIKNLIKKIQTKMKKGHIEIQFKTDNHGSQSRRCPDMSKLKLLYNFKTTSIDVGLDKTIKWYLKNQ
jgi:UDP-glucose 4-epimerase